MRAEGQSSCPTGSTRSGAAPTSRATTGFVVREKTAPADAPPLFRARWVVLRYAGLSERERRWWPYRNILLVAMPSGARYVVESSLGFRDESHLEEERPWERVASARAAFEIWTSGSGAVAAGNRAFFRAVRGPAPAVLRAPGGGLSFFLEDLGSRTVRASLEEIGSATFDEDERRDLALLLRTSVESNVTLSTELPVLNLRDPAARRQRRPEGSGPRARQADARLRAGLRPECASGLWGSLPGGAPLRTCRWTSRPSRPCRRRGA